MSSPLQLLAAAAAGGAVGASLRFLTGWFVQHGRWAPATSVSATLVVNVAGCLAIGWLLGGEKLDSEWLRALVVTGVLGGLTTFSAFGWEAVVLFEEQGLGRSLLATGAHVVLGLAAVFIGSKLA